jgi:outer membrane protein TolC
MSARVLAFVVTCACIPASVENLAAAPRSYDVDQTVALALAQNPEIAIARKKVQAARGGVVEARSGFLPSVVSSGLLRQREHQADSRLRDEDYNVSVRVVQSLYTGGATASQLAIARLNVEKEELELQALLNRVAMDVRVSFSELLLNRAKIRVYAQSVNVLQEELKTQQERLAAGTVGQLNVRRAEVALANEQPQLIDAQTQLKSSYLRLAELVGMPSWPANFEVTGQLQYQPLYPDMNACLARADVERPEIKAREKEIEVEDRQADLDRSALRPQVEAFSGYEVYNERDPLVGREFNHGYVVGLNAQWHIFDGHATKGRLEATHARREAAVQTLKSTRLSVEADVRSAFLDLEQAARVLEFETKNVQTADESLNLAKANLGAGLGTQLDVLQATADVTRTRTTRLAAIFQHNVALARLARACASSPPELAFQPPNPSGTRRKDAAIVELTEPPQKLEEK